HRGHRQRRPGRQRPGGDRGGDGVGRVVEPVGVREEEGDADDDDECGGVHPAQDSLTAMVSTVFATCSKASAACSRTSTTCLSLSTSMASYWPLKRWASSLRWIWSAWFSSRLISIQYSVRLSMVRRFGIAAAVSSAALASTSICCSIPCGSCCMS